MVEMLVIKSIALSVQSFETGGLRQLKRPQRRGLKGLLSLSAVSGQFDRKTCHLASSQIRLGA